jgi:hypothetical protein
MGSMTFTRMDSKIDGAVLGKFSFDSSPDYSICKRFGLDPAKFRLEEISRTDNQAMFDVYGGQRLSETVHYVGSLSWEKPKYLQG